MTANTLVETTLDSKYVQASGRLFLSGTQALVRLPIQQSLRDGAVGLDTAGYVTGYRGSPLGRYVTFLATLTIGCNALLRVAKLLPDPAPA